MLDAYREVVAQPVLDEVYRLAEALQGRTLQHINSTRSGGGVAEILHRLVPLTDALGIATTWDVISGSQEFFEVTKAFHNALQGREQELSHEDFAVYLHSIQENAKTLRLSADVVMVHDPQPVALVEYCRRDGVTKWGQVLQSHNDQEGSLVHAMLRL